MGYSILIPEQVQEKFNEISTTHSNFKIQLKDTIEYLKTKPDNNGFEFLAESFKGFTCCGIIVGEHMIYYTVEEKTINIVGVKRFFKIRW